MSRYDLIIRHGTIVDGTGSERYVADVAVAGDRIAAIGELDPADAEQTIDADGLIVAPGFIDPHTHYDAQLCWDPLASPSPFHGVTTIFGGLCGFTLSPATPEALNYLVPMLSQVEDIPLQSLREGVPADWRTFSEYRSKLEGRIAVNAGFSAGHSAIRRVVMGDRALGHEATSEDLAAMKRLLADALSQGALGFSTSNSITHNDHNGGPVPSRFASYDEFVGLASVCRDFEGASLEIQPGLSYDEDAKALLAGMSVAADRTLNWNLIMVNSLAPTEIALAERQLAMSDYARERGGEVIGLTVPVGVAVHMDFKRGGGFDTISGWDRLFKLGVQERIAALKEQSFRDYLRESARGATEFGQRVLNPELFMLEKGYSELTCGFAGQTIAQIAAALRRDPFDTLLDMALADDLKTLFCFIEQGEDRDTYAYRAKLWRDNRTCVGASDAGAHVETIDSFSYFTRMIEQAVNKHGVISLEECVQHITQAPARLTGLRNRGEIRTGWHADLAIFQQDAVKRGTVELVSDFPAGASRLYAKPEGMRHVIVNGVEIVRDGQYSGAIPGSFLMRGKDTRSVTATAALAGARLGR